MGLTYPRSKIGSQSNDKGFQKKCRIKHPHDAERNVGMLNLMVFS